jgi:segregation and condensation protein A
LITDSSKDEQRHEILVEGQAVTDLPDDLFIPPDALEVYLERFEGPLDLLLYLIRKQNFDILNIPIATITEQYMEYIQLMKSLKIELAAEYLLMAAMLANIKSRMLLPKPKVEEGEEEFDPRQELLRRLQEYECFQKAASDLDALPRQERDLFEINVEVCKSLFEEKPLPEVSFDALMQAFKDVLNRQKNTKHHTIEQEPLSIRERMGVVLARLQDKPYVLFTELFETKEGRIGLVVTFIAVLELMKQAMLQLVQTHPFAPIRITLSSEA